MRPVHGGLVAVLAVAATMVAVAMAPGAGAASGYSNPTRIDNQFLPLVPGRQYVLEGVADRGNGVKPHRVVTTVTSVTKVINGVKARVVWDQDFSAGKLVESELAFFAQDDTGTVKALGEYPEELDASAFPSAPNTWIDGLEGAKAGIAMLAKPVVGARYSQGYAPQIGFGDQGLVVSTTATLTNVPLGPFTNVLVVEESNTFAPQDGQQQKFHKAGTGVVRVTAKADPEGEFLNLVKATTLSASALGDANGEAVTLDRRGHVLSPVYRSTPWAER
ncbi:MAG: hypothetical protein QOJ69_529 [Actinomycetota bacterium]|jgi:hypothetical protein|nr:hypothetical protein [Actinomycetota bacterium]MEA2842858.1 hypothetical protein [Actinomycetota bacterium]